MLSGTECAGLTGHGWVPCCPILFPPWPWVLQLPQVGEEVFTPDCLRRTTNSPYQQLSPQHDLGSWTHLGFDHGLLLTAVEVWQALVTTVLSPVTMEVLE